MKKEKLFMIFSSISILFLLAFLGCAGEEYLTNPNNEDITFTESQSDTETTEDDSKEFGGDFLMSDPLHGDPLLGDGLIGDPLIHEGLIGEGLMDGLITDGIAGGFYGDGFFELNDEPEPQDDPLKKYLSPYEDEDPDLGDIYDAAEDYCGAHGGCDSWEFEMFDHGLSAIIKLITIDGQMEKIIWRFCN